MLPPGEYKRAIPPFTKSRWSLFITAFVLNGYCGLIVTADAANKSFNSFVVTLEDRVLASFSSL